ncbi:MULTISPECIES: hypothetical protein [unclassified Marinitoga]|nr:MULTISPECIES: hypothetical protein [unclassified Marinitoga]KLO24158.1 hypothetical protein X274_04700 [Marinitoga sp. 1155]
MKIIKNYLNKKLGFMEKKASNSEIDTLLENLKEEALEELYINNNLI